MMSVGVYFYWKETPVSVQEIVRDNKACEKMKAGD